MSDSCWFVLTRVRLVLIRVDSCQTRVDSCWLVSESCWFVLDSCWLVSESCWFVLICVDSCRNRVDSCWTRVDSYWFMLTCVGTRVLKQTWSIWTIKIPDFLDNGVVNLLKLWVDFTRFRARSSSRRCSIKRLFWKFS